jgi:hypothetical protein
MVIKDFWVSLIERLLKEQFLPVIYNNYYTHDVSPHFLEKCLYLSNLDVSGVMSAMRSTGCVLDVFTGISRLAIGARCPFVVMRERIAVNTLKDYEIDDLCGEGTPKEYVYIFPSISDEINKPLWNQSLFDGMIAKLNTIMMDFNRDNWPSPLESYEIMTYDRVRRIKNKKLGTKFIKVPRF